MVRTGGHQQADEDDEQRRQQEDHDPAALGPSSRQNRHEPVEEQEDDDDHSEPDGDRDQCVPQVTHVHYPPTGFLRLAGRFPETRLPADPKDLQATDTTYFFNAP